MGSQTAHRGLKKKCSCRVSLHKLWGTFGVASRVPSSISNFKLGADNSGGVVFELRIVMGGK